MGKGAAPLNFSAGVLRLDDTAYRRIPARLTTVASTTVTTGVTQYRYGFVEQIFNPTTGIYTDRYDGLKGDGQYTYATELNNQAITGPFAGTTAVTTGGIGPFVWVRNKGQINGSAVYEFNHSPSYQTSAIAGTSLTTTWADVGTSFFLPPWSVWSLQAQLNATIFASSSGAGDSVSMRFYDGSATAGSGIEFCDAVCDNLTYTDAAPLMTVYVVTATGVTINLQGIINTATESTASLLGTGDFSGSEMVGIRIL